MHVTSYICARVFFELLALHNFSSCDLRQTCTSIKILDLGSMDINGSIRRAIEDATSFGAAHSWEHYGVDMERGPNVDVVIAPGAKFPFERESFDVIVSSSALEHDKEFWVTFERLSRLLKPGGLMYLLLPSAGPQHFYPIDAWRFYPDSAGALAQWATKMGAPLRVLHSYVDPTDYGGFQQSDWRDHVMIFRQSSDPPGDPHDTAEQDALLSLFHEEVQTRINSPEGVPLFLNALTAINQQDKDGTVVCPATSEVANSECLTWRWSPQRDTKSSGKEAQQEAKKAALGLEQQNSAPAGIVEREYAMLQERLTPAQLDHFFALMALDRVPNLAA
mmetsp:Transcript_8465/g.19238  ORF Transcript_8465/g.19238 Transcript_8465/m.19238 type:complete len:334 (+) Transcript_8465:82-1083(+)